MNAKEFADKLNELNACQTAIDWAKGKSLSEAWEQCERSDWMFWLLRRSTVSKQVEVAIACNIAESVVHLAKSPAAGEAIKAARQYMAGEITIEELRVKRSPAAAAADAYAAAAAAAAKQRRINCDIIRKHIPANEIGNLLTAREESGR